MAHALGFDRASARASARGRADVDRACLPPAAAAPDPPVQRDPRVLPDRQDRRDRARGWVHLISPPPAPSPALSPALGSVDPQS